MSFSENLRNELYYQDITFKQFSKKIKIPYNTLLSYVSKKPNMPTVEIAYRMAQTLNVTLEYLITGEDKQLKEQSTKLNEICKDLLNLPREYISLVEKLIIQCSKLTEIEKQLREIKNERR